MVTNELRGERVDVVPFSDDPVELIQSALAPARVREVRLDDETGTATVIVSDYQLSLAIGKEGQNARLAARLTGWRIDIKSETQLADEESGYAGEEWAEGEWIQNEAGEMVWQPAEGGTAVSATEWSQGADGAEPAAGGRAGRRRRAGHRGCDGSHRGHDGRHRRVRSGPPRGQRTTPPAVPIRSAPSRCRRLLRAGRLPNSPGPDLHRLPPDGGDGPAGPGGPWVRAGRWSQVAPSPGRGAWLCRESPGCFDRAVKRRAFERALTEPGGRRRSGVVEDRPRIGVEPPGRWRARRVRSRDVRG